MEDKIKQFINDEISAYGVDWLSFTAVKLHIYCVIFNTLYNQELCQKMLKFKGEKIAHLDDRNEYTEMIVDLYCKAGGRDTGTGFGQNEMYAFVAWAVEDIDNRKKAAMTQEKRNKIEQLERDKKKAEAELTRLLAE